MIEGDEKVQDKYQHKITWIEVVKKITTLSNANLTKNSTPNLPSKIFYSALK